MDIKKTANLLLNFTLKRLAEISGILIFSTGILLFIALFSYSPEDPNFIFPKDTKIKNLLGFQGSFISDLFFQSFGFIAYLISFTYMITGINIFRVKEFFLIIENTFIAILYTILGTLFLSHFYSDAFTLYINGNGGFVGNYFGQTFLTSIILINETLIYYVLMILVITLFLLSINFHPIKFYNSIIKIIKIFHYSFIIGPTCPNNFEMNIGEEDGRSCYGIIAETSSSISKDALQVQNPNIFYLLSIIIMQ